MSENIIKANKSPTDNEKQSGGVNGRKEEKKPTATATEPKSVIYKIGRASCRERV